MPRDLCVGFPCGHPGTPTGAKRNTTCRGRALDPRAAVRRRRPGSQDLPQPGPVGPACHSRAVGPVGRRSSVVVRRTTRSVDAVVLRIRRCSAGARLGSSRSSRRSGVVVRSRRSGDSSGSSWDRCLGSGPAEPRGSDWALRGEHPRPSATASDALAPEPPVPLGLPFGAVVLVRSLAGRCAVGLRPLSTTRSNNGSRKQVKGSPRNPPVVHRIPAKSPTRASFHTASSTTSCTAARRRGPARPRPPPTDEGPWYKAYLTP